MKILMLIVCVSFSACAVPVDSTESIIDNNAREKAEATAVDPYLIPCVQVYATKPPCDKCFYDMRDSTTVCF